MEYKNKNTEGRRRYKTRYKNPHNYKTKRTKAETRSAVLVAVTTFVVLAALVVMFTFGENIYNFMEHAFAPASPDQVEFQVSTVPVNVVETEAPATEAPTEAPTEPTTEAPKKQGKENTASGDFNTLIKAAGIDAASLNASQMIFVQATGTSCTVYTYEKNESGKWTQKFDPMTGFVGAGGVGSSTPNDEVTPKGAFKIEYAFGTNANPGAKLEYLDVVYGMRWITDPNSINYNHLLDYDAVFEDYTSCQWLHEYTVSYPYAVVFDYNRNPTDPALGAAKFLHVSAKPTAGGVGISEENLKEILLWLDPALSPEISIF